MLVLTPRPLAPWARPRQGRIPWGEREARDANGLAPVSQAKHTEASELVHALGGGEQWREGG